MQKEKEKIVKNHPKMLHYLMLVGLKIVFIAANVCFIQSSQSFKD